MPFDHFPAADFDRAEDALKCVLNDADWPGDEQAEARFDWSNIEAALRARGVERMLARAFRERLIESGESRLEREEWPAGQGLEEGRPTFHTEPNCTEFLVTTWHGWQRYLASRILCSPDFIPIASDTPDLGTAHTVGEFGEWCHRHREGLRQFRRRLGEPRPAFVAPAEFRSLPEVIRQCRQYLLGFGVSDIPERFAFSTLPYNQTPSGPEHFPSEMEAFICWASSYRAPGHSILKLIGDVEELLTWAMAWCSQRTTPAPQGTQTHTPPAEQGEATWLNVTEAAQASGCTKGEISRAAGNGSLKSNGKKGRQRRIDAADLTLWQLRRAKRSAVVESDAAVERKLNRADRE